MFGIFRRRAYDVPPLFRLKGNFIEKKKERRKKEEEKWRRRNATERYATYGRMPENNIEAMLFAKILFLKRGSRLLSPLV